MNNFNIIKMEIIDRLVRCLNENESLNKKISNITLINLLLDYYNTGETDPKKFNTFINKNMPKYHKYTTEYPANEIYCKFHYMAYNKLIAGIKNGHITKNSIVKMITWFNSLCADKRDN